MTNSPLSKKFNLDSSQLPQPPSQSQSLPQAHPQLPDDPDDHLRRNVRSSDRPDSVLDVEIKEQDRWLPIANVARLMKNALPENAKIAKEAKECMQECVSEFISFITSEASEKCQQERRKTVNGEDILFAMTSLGFENYAEALKIYLARYRETLLANQNNPPVMHHHHHYQPPSSHHHHHQQHATHQANLADPDPISQNNQDQNSLSSESYDIHHHHQHQQQHQRPEHLNHASLSSERILGMPDFTKHPAHRNAGRDNPPPY